MDIVAPLNCISLKLETCCVFLTIGANNSSASVCTATRYFAKLDDLVVFF